MEIERTVWNAPDLEVPFNLYIVAAETGGQVLGAFEGDRLVGFLLALVGLRAGCVYLHSHMAAVLPEARNRGIGRGLKLFQRQDALDRGIDLVEWTFDPLEIKNAHFNLMSLGAVARRYEPNAYGVTASPLHGGLPTDRLFAEWNLRAERVERCVAGLPPVAGAGSSAVRIAVSESIGELKLSDPEAARRVQDGVRGEFLHWFERGYVAVAIERSAGEAAYVLEPAGLGVPEVRGPSAGSGP